MTRTGCASVPGACVRSRRYNPRRRSLLSSSRWLRIWRSGQLILSRSRIRQRRRRRLRRRGSGNGPPSTTTRDLWRPSRRTWQALHSAAPPQAGRISPLGTTSASRRARSACSLYSEALRGLHATSTSAGCGVVATQRERVGPALQSRRKSWAGAAKPAQGLPNRNDTGLGGVASLEHRFRERAPATSPTTV